MDEDSILMSFSKFMEVSMAAALTLIVGLYFHLSNKLDEIQKNQVDILSIGIELQQKHEALKEAVIRNQLDVEALRIFDIAITAKLTEQKEELKGDIYKLMIDCKRWIKDINDKLTIQ